MDWLNAWVIALQQRLSENIACDSDKPDKRRVGWLLVSFMVAVWMLFGLFLLSLEPRNEFEREMMRRVSCEMRNSC